MWRILMGRPKTGINRKCDNETCNVTIYVHKHKMEKSKYCCKKCQYEDKRRKYNNDELVQWNKGLTKETSDIIKQNAENHIGFKHTKETIEKIRVASLEHWKDDEYREKVITNAKIRIRKSYATGNRKQPIKYDTAPELRIEAILKELNVDYIKQFPLTVSYPKTYVSTKFYDFYLPNFNLILEVHGDYWHGYDIPWEKCNHIQQQTKYNDQVKLKLAFDNFKKIQYIWEHETKNKEQLYEKISKILCTDSKSMGLPMAYLS